MAVRSGKQKSTVYRDLLAQHKTEAAMAEFEPIKGAIVRFFFLVVIFSVATLAHAHETLPWGSAQTRHIDYAPQKVVYDVAAHSPAELDQILDRVSGLSNVYRADPLDASIVLVLHGDEMEYFDARRFDQHEALMRRAQSLTVGGIIEFRMCSIAAANRGLTADNVHGFVQMVPMGDAEIARLQHEESYAYMH